MKYSIITFGCRVNHADSLRIEEDLRARGGIDVPSSEADVVVVNTCSVTATADQGARQAIRRIARENGRARIVVTGCYATRRRDEVGELPNVLHVISNSDKDGLASVVSELDFCDRSGDGPCGAPIEPGFAGRTAFTLRVQTGCEERCSYCIIPSTRGPGRSVPCREVVREVQRIAAAGFKEIVLTGVHLGSYGRDLTPPSSLYELLRALSRIEVDVAFRVSSLEPMDCTQEIVDLIAESEGRFAPHFHLPLQHASDTMLALMGRAYTIDHYRRLVDRIHARIPHAFIGTDLIVGFPGETDERFDANLQYLPSSPLAQLHVFPYSERPGTVAAGLDGKVAGAAVRERGARLRAISQELSRRFRKAQVGVVRPGLTLDDGTVVVTDNYVKVPIPPGRPRNERVRVLLTEGGGVVLQ